MSNKVHAFGDRRIGGDRTTACMTYFAEGHMCVAASDDPAEVTCANCLKKIAKRPA